MRFRLPIRLGQVKGVCVPVPFRPVRARFATRNGVCGESASPGRHVAATDGDQRE